MGRIVATVGGQVASLRLFTLGAAKTACPQVLRSLAASFEPRLRANARVGSYVNGLPRVAKLAAHGALNRVEVPRALVAWLVEDLGQDPDVP